MTQTKLYITPYGTDVWKEYDNVPVKAESLNLADPQSCGRWWKEIHGSPTEFSFTGTIKYAAEVRKALIRGFPPMQNFLKAVRYGRSVYGHNSFIEMSYGLYKTAQYICHRDYGCNLKRFLRENRINVRVRYKTKNGYWVWMK